MSKTDSQIWINLRSIALAGATNAALRVKSPRFMRDSRQQRRQARLSTHGWPLLFEPRPNIPPAFVIATITRARGPDQGELFCGPPAMPRLDAGSDPLFKAALV